VLEWLTQEVSQSAATCPVAFAAGADVLFPLGNELPAELVTWEFAGTFDPDLRICFTSLTRERRWS